MKRTQKLTANLSARFSTRLLPLLLATACPLAATGCLADGPKADGERPPMITPPSSSEPQRAASASPMVELPKGSDRVLAEIAGVKVTESQVLPSLYASYGLELLLKVAQLDMAKAEAGRDGLTVSQADIDTERRYTFELAFPDQDPADYDNLLKQMLSQQHVSLPEFEIVMQTNAYLRALVRKSAAEGMTEDLIRNEFNALYGERVRVRHIALSNLQEVAEAKRRLGLQGAQFEEVARQMSKDPTTARLGGALPPFSRTAVNVPPTFVAAAFALQVGQVSDDAVSAGNYYHIIKLEERIAPVAQKYEDVRESVRMKLLHSRELYLMAQRRAEMADRARHDMTILEPSLKQQFDERLKAANPTVPTDRDKENARLDALREKIQGPATAPSATQPTSTPPGAAAGTLTSPVTTPLATPATVPTTMP